MKIRTNIPVTLCDFVVSEDKRFTKAKLKIFHKEPTKDKRFFTTKFINSILANLAAVPVIGYYDEESEDFVGHNVTQYIYGHIPETYTVEFLEENGKNFAIVDVILQTGRDDNIGEVAKKIIGKQHSLELNPETLKIKVIREGDAVSRIDFLEGEVIGLSVVGDNQSPGFEGSEFFMATATSEFTTACYQRLDEFVNYLKNKERGSIQVLEMNNFLQLAYDTQTELVGKLYKALEAKGFYACIFDVGADWFTTSKNGEFYRISFTSEDGVISIGEPEKVVYRAITEEEARLLSDGAANATIATATPPIDNAEGGDNTENANATATTEDVANATTIINAAVAAPEEGNNDGVQTEEPKTTTEPGIPATNFTEEGEGEGKEAPKNVASATVLDDAERAELTAFREAAKKSIINSYVDELDTAVLEDFTARISEFTIDDLEAALAVIYRKAQKTAKTAEATAPAVTVFNLNNTANSTSYDEACAEDVIKKYTNKR